MKYKSIIIIGQTASGKTYLAHMLYNYFKSKNIPSEIVNLDAFQIYTDVSTGTAKPNSQEQQEYKYHCVNLCRAGDAMDANKFAALAHNACQEITLRGAVPICVGGSGLYLRAFLHGLDEFPEHNPAVRQKIRNYAQEHGWDKCYDWLAKVDPIRAKELHPNDHVRVERALEIFEITKTPVSELQTKKTPLHLQDTYFESFVIHTQIDSDELKRNILQRTKELFAHGWVDEVQCLYQKYGEDIWNFNSMRAIGYKDILHALQKGVAVKVQDNALIEQIARATAQYAKRQKTWNKKEKTDFLIHPKNADEFKKLVDTLEDFLI